MNCPFIHEVSFLFFLFNTFLYILTNFCFILNFNNFLYFFTDSKAIIFCSLMEQIILDETSGCVNRL